MAENGESENGGAAPNGAASGDAKPGEGQAGNGAAQQVQVKMNVLGQYVRDLSFENVLAQKGAKGEVTPELSIGVAVEPRKRSADNQYEVLMKVKVTSRNKGTEDVLFLMEMDYGGLFSIEGVPEKQLHPFLMIECPRMLFPFVRRIVSDVTRDGGFPAVNMETIDFMSLYRQQLAQLAAKQAEAKEAEGQPS